MSKAKRAIQPTNASEKPLNESYRGESFELSEVKERADQLGCFMQMYVAYNPDTEMMVFASNDPSARIGKPSEEALLLAALVVEHLADEANPAKSSGDLH